MVSNPKQETLQLRALKLQTSIKGTFPLFTLTLRPRLIAPLPNIGRQPSFPFLPPSFLSPFLESCHSYVSWRANSSAGPFKGQGKVSWVPFSIFIDSHVLNLYFLLPVAWFCWHARYDNPNYSLLAAHCNYMSMSYQSDKQHENKNSAGPVHNSSPAKDWPWPLHSLEKCCRQPINTKSSGQ